MATYRRTADFRVSATDPDASPMPGRGGGLDLGYHDHYVVDGGKARIILAPLVTPAEVQENQPDAGPAVADPLPLEAAAAAGDRGHHVRHHREHRGR